MSTTQGDDAKTEPTTTTTGPFAGLAWTSSFKAELAKMRADAKPQQETPTPAPCVLR